MPRTSRLLVAALAATVAPFALAPSSALAGTGDERPFPDRIFGADSPFYQRLPENTPTAPDSDALVADLVRSSHEHWGTPTRRNVDISTHRWAPTMYVARSTDPVAVITPDNCQRKEGGWDRELVEDHFKDVRIPADARPDSSGDGSMVVYNPDTDTVTETWITRKHGPDRWTACFGGTIRKASTQLGQHRSYYGVTASGLAAAAFAIRPAELRRGHISHVVALNIPRVKAGVVSWPATRSDGTTWGTALAEGQLLRLPADLDLDAMRLSPVARTIAKAAQEYGVIVTDTGGSVSFVAQNADSFDTDPYPALLRGRWPAQEMNGDEGRGEQPFPLDRLVALPVGHRVQGVPDDTDRRVPEVDVIRQSANPDGPVTDHAGNTWAARRPGTFNSERVSVRPSWVTTTGTKDPQLYAKTAWGFTQYGLKVPNGTYDVTLAMSEDWWDAPGKRVFDVYGEGRLALDDVDVYAETGGRYRALERTFPVRVTDGQLDLAWDVMRDNALVNAISIVPR